MRRFFGKLYVQVLIGVFAGVALGFFAPGIGSDLKPVGDVFILVGGGLTGWRSWVNPTPPGGSGGGRSCAHS